MARVRASHLYIIMTAGALVGGIVTYLQYRRLWIAGVAGLSGAVMANLIVALMHPRDSQAEIPAEPVTPSVRLDSAGSIHWSKKVGIALVVLGLTDFLLAASRRDIVNVVFGVIFVTNGAFLILRRVQ